MLGYNDNNVCLVKIEEDNLKSQADYLNKTFFPHSIFCFASIEQSKSLFLLLLSQSIFL